LKQIVKEIEIREEDLLLSSSHAVTEATFTGPDLRKAASLPLTDEKNRVKRLDGAGG
jgi:hypothetical protein